MDRLCQKNLAQTVSDRIRVRQQVQPDEPVTRIEIVLNWFQKLK